MTLANFESPWMDEETRIFRKVVSEFIAKELAPHQTRWGEQRRPDAEAWSKAGKAGLLLPDVPEEYGGGGGTFAHEAVIVEELARAGVHFGTIVQSMAARYLVAYGSEAQKRK